MTVLEPKLIGYKPSSINLFCRTKMLPTKSFGTWTVDVLRGCIFATELVIKHRGFVTYGDNNRDR